MKKSCLNCSKRPKCTSICSSAEEYIGQDYNEEVWLNISFTDRTDKLEPCKVKKMMDKVSTTEAILQNYFLDRMKPQDIAKRYYKSPQYVYWLIKKYSKIIAENIKKSTESC